MCLWWLVQALQGVKDTVFHLNAITQREPRCVGELVVCLERASAYYPEVVDKAKTSEQLLDVVRRCEGR